MRKSLLEKNYLLIEARAMMRYIYSFLQLKQLLIDLKHARLIPQSLSYTIFYELLLKMGLIRYEIELGNFNFVRYSFDKDVDIYRLALSFKKNCFLSMSTALNIQGYSNYRNDFVFVSCELPEKNCEHNDLTQRAIDNAFSKPYRRTHSINNFEEKNIVYLTPKFTKNYGVLKGKMPTSSINRALVEMIINIQYFRNSLEIIRIYTPLKSKLDINEIYNVVNKFNLIYPYFQCVGFYLEKIGFKKEELSIFQAKIGELWFYTDKNQNKYSSDNYWQMYYLNNTNSNI